MTRKLRREADVDTLLVKVIKRTGERGEEIDARLNALIETAWSCDSMVACVDLNHRPTLVGFDEVWVEDSER